MKSWASEGREKINKSIWENTANPERQRYFDNCLTKLATYNKEVTEPIRKPITKKLKRDVWTNTFGKVKEASCRCGTTITLEISECGHIVSHAREGQTVIDNLRPICSKCNRSMGTRNMDEYFDEEYPAEI
jgi:5-methylcytosine-specific restriction endonuclease McrA